MDALRIAIFAKQKEVLCLDFEINPFVLNDCYMKFWSIFTKVIDVLVMVWNIVRGSIPGNSQTAIENK